LLVNNSTCDYNYQKVKLSPHNIFYINLSSHPFSS
jgi:hypothetical protein